MRLAGRPGRELVDLGRELVEVVAHEHDQRATRLRVGLGAVQLELLGDPGLNALLRDVPDQHLAGGRDRLRERRVLLQLVRDERERGRRRGRLEVGGDRLGVVRLPGLDAVDDDQPAVAREETEGVRGGDDVLARGIGRRRATRRRRARSGRAVAGARGRPSGGRSRRAGRRASAPRPSPPSIGARRERRPRPPRARGTS